MAQKKGKRFPVRGLEKHGQRYRWQRVVGGRRIRHTFDANSDADAIRIAMELESRPELLDAGAWEFEARRYVAQAVAGERLSKGYGGDRLGCLLREGVQMGLASPRDLTVARLQGWYDDGVNGRWPMLDEVGETVLGKDGEPRCRKVGVVAVNHYLKHVRVFGDWLVSERLLFDNPAAAVVALPDPVNTRDVFVESEDVARLLAAARDAWDPEFERFPTLELFLLLTCECGMRKGEADAARAEWVDLERAMIVIPAEDVFEGRVWNRKGVAGRRRQVSVPMVGALRDWFREYGVPSPFLLKPEIGWGRYRYRYQISTRVVRFLKAHDMEHVTVHDLRRSFGSNRVSAGTSIEKVANWMGISIKTAWDRYARFVPNDDEIEKGAAVPAEIQDSRLKIQEGRSVKERLVELRELLDAGLISGADFELKKGEILTGV